MPNEDNQDSKQELKKESLEIIKKIILLEKDKNKSIYKDQLDNTNYDFINDRINGCFKLLDPETQSLLSQELENTKNSKIFETEKLNDLLRNFAAKINRSLASFSNKELAKALKNFKDVEAPSLNDTSGELVFLSDDFVKNFTENVNKTFNDKKLLSPMIGFIQTELGSINSTNLGFNINKKELYNITSKLIYGAITNKSNISHQRSIDSDIVDNFGRIKDPLISAIGEFIVRNYDDLKNLDGKPLRKMGGELKQFIKKSEVKATERLIKDFEKAPSVEEMLKIKTLSDKEIKNKETSTPSLNVKRVKSKYRGL